MSTETKQTESKSVGDKEPKLAGPETATLEPIILPDEFVRPDRFSGQPVHSTNRRLHQAQVLQMQRTFGHRAVRGLLEQTRPTPTSQSVQRIPAGRPSPASSPSGTTATTGSTLAATPATAMSPLPVAVIEDHNQRFHSGDQQGALMAVVRHMEAQGEIDTSIMAPPTAVGRQAVCANTNRYIVNPGMGSTALTTNK